MWKALDIWLLPYLSREREAGRARCTDLMLAVCDHFEPFHKADKEKALLRVADWKEGLARFGEMFHDSDGVGPRQSFFYPIEQYDSDVVEAIAGICRESGSEMEVHLHHDNDSPEGLEEALREGVRRFQEHGCLGRDGEGKPVFGFIHGNWALDHSHPQGKHCGVSNELAVLKAAGCYADFTMPSAPDPTQTKILNSIYYAAAGEEPKSHDRGTSVSAGDGGTSGLRESADHLLMVQGPLGLNWRRRKWGLLPRVENADLTGANPPSESRLKLWIELGIHVGGRPEWRFAKLHTHGALERNSSALLGEPMESFHRGLVEGLSQEEGCRVHYVNAREMVNIIHAAEDGLEGDPGEYRDYLYRPPGGR